jgi:hypothetical protein
MLTFSVVGPIEVPTYAGKCAKIVDAEALGSFWEKSNIAERSGCYIFSVRASRGYKPVYVGLATKTFKQEVFAPHKLEKYQRCLADTRKGVPVVFFVTLPTARGRKNTKVIRQLEDFLIQTCVSRNPDLLNVKGTDQAEWGISGVIRGGKGKPSRGELALKRTLGL